MALVLQANVFYGEAELVDGLGLSKTWLRRVVGGQRGGYNRVYNGARVLAALKTCPPSSTALTCTKTPGRRSGGRAATLPEAADERSDGQPASESTTPTGEKSLVAWAKERLKQRREVEPLSSARNAKRTRKQGYAR
jgi:hypothetical protein